MVIFTLLTLPGLHAKTAWIIVSALINSKKPIVWKKVNAFHYSRLFIRIAFQIKFNTVAERVHLIYWVLKEDIANRKISFLANLDEPHRQGRMHL